MKKPTIIQDSQNMTYKEIAPATEPFGFTEFVFDHRTQQRIVPKAAARAGNYFGDRTMNSGGRAAGYIGRKNLD